MYPQAYPIKGLLASFCIMSKRAFSRNESWSLCMCCCSWCCRAPRAPCALFAPPLPLLPGNYHLHRKLLFTSVCYRAPHALFARTWTLTSENLGAGATLYSLAKEKNCFPLFVTKKKGGKIVVRVILIIPSYLWCVMSRCGSKRWKTLAWVGGKKKPGNVLRFSLLCGWWVTEVERVAWSNLLKSQWRRIFTTQNHYIYYTESLYKGLLRNSRLIQLLERQRFR